MRRDWVGGIAACLIGLAVIAYTFGTGILPPGHTGWMLRGTIGPDPVQYWLGWTYFSRDAWRWPPGLNPDYGLEISSSIFFSDSIPLLAFAFKALSGLVEVPQYWGLWLYACGALQAWFGWRLAGLATEDRLPRLGAAALFALSPTMLNRLGGHFAVGAHFLLLAGLLLCLTAAPLRQRLAAWAVLVLTASWIHAYLLPMVLGLWAADWLARALRERRWVSLVEAFGMPAVGVLGLWLAGFFTIKGGFAGTWGEYGRMQLDLLGPLAPAPWGRFLPELPRADHMEAGHSYAGLGVLLALGIGLLLWLKGGARGLLRHWLLLLALAAMLGFAVTHRVAIGGHEFLLFDPPARLVAMASALRASERFFWPALYAALFAAIAAIVRGLGGRRAGLLLVVLAAVQFADMQPGFARLWRYFPPEQSVVPLRLKDPFWLEAARRYDRVRLAPTGLQARHWEEVAVFAATCRLPTDAVYLARVDPDRAAALNAAVLAQLQGGAPEPATLYVLGSEETLAAARAGLRTGDLLERLDGMWVLAPGWHARADAPGVRMKRLGRVLLRIAAALVVLPLALMLLFRFIPPPATPLMLIRLAEGFGWQRDWVPRERLAPTLAAAVIASEDNLFCAQWFGFDVDALSDQLAAWRRGDRPRGASTITMQTAKNLFLWPGRDPLRKGLEAWLTPQLALLWPRPRVLEVYLNIVEFAPGIYGAEAAARHIFRKAAADLSQHEAALLAALLPAPLTWSIGDPHVRQRAAVIERRVGQIRPLLACAW